MLNPLQVKLKILVELFKHQLTLVAEVDLDRDLINLIFSCYTLAVKAFFRC